MAISGIIVADSKSGVDQNVLLPWWSFTKTILAAAVLVLVGQSRLSLDEPIERKPYSLRNLLQHTSGLPDYGNLAQYHAAVANGEEPWPRDEVLNQVNVNALLFAPGESWAYSNVGYLFVREILESTMQMPLDAALRKLIFEPLDAPDVFIATVPEHFDRTLWSNKRGYHPGWVYHGLAIGPASSSAKILERLVYGPLLSSHLRQQLLTAVSLGRRFPGRPAIAPGYGLGFMIDSRSSLGRMIGHTGQGPGSTAAVYSFPDLAQPRTLSAFAPSDGADAQGALENHILTLASDLQLGAIIDPTGHQ